MKRLMISKLALWCLPIIGYSATITLDEGLPATSRAAVPANTLPGDVILCDTAVDAAGTDCITVLDRSDIIFINTRNYGGFPEADLYSANNDLDIQFSDLTRVVVTDPQHDGMPLVNPIALLEVGASTPYTPSPNEPGFFNGASYVFLSDGDAAVPEPGTLFLVGSALAGLASLRHTNRNKQPQSPESAENALRRATHF